ncbi:type II secretion system protein [Vibrio sp. SCSIO 43135]|uniref:type II secretion system protein n=1 Tax=Vibrio sp. SCSIO 43135 TaxID=2819096 RepID=UPI0020750F58|nr:type II secretion system protein [Vibrio sp. SCSIO 43135]USD43816.1 type II secretion system protein [Vibrio sp. SCSIO 43135]
MKKWKVITLGFTIVIGSAFAYYQSAVSASKSGEVQAVLEDLDTVLEAARQYYLDNGTLPPITSDTDPEFGYLNINNLIDDPSLTTWRGPYLPYDDTWIGGEQYIGHPEYVATQLLLKETGSEWVRGSIPTGCKQNSASCSIAACIWFVPLEVAQEINQIVDGEQSLESYSADGTIRYDKALLGSLVCKIGETYPMPSSRS